MTVTIPANGPPAAPQNLSASPGDQQMTLTWTAPETSGGAPITHYDYRYYGGASVPDETAWNSIGTLTATVVGLVNGTEYAFEVRAVSDIGPGLAAVGTVTPQAETTVPGAPQNLSATPGGGRVTLAWQAPASDGGAAITDYEYRHAQGDSVPEGTTWASAGADLTVTVRSLANGTTYVFEVRALNRVGGGPAATVTATPAAAETVEPEPVVTAPSAPRNLLATPGDDRVTLAWQAPASDGGAAITDYEYRHAQGDSVPEGTAWASTGADLTVTVRSLANGTTHVFEVRALNRVGGGPAATVTAAPAAAETVEPELVVTAPSAPRNLLATPGDSRVTLAWQTPANDGGAAISGYEFRYAEGVSVPERTAWVSAGTDLTVTVSGLSDGAEHAFEVRALNGVGHGVAARAMVRVLGLPMLSAGDAEAREGVDATIDFPVALSRASTRTVTIDYATADGSAKADEDYRRAAGTLTFAAGETEKTISVVLLDDAKDEGKETFALTLSNARGARIVDARATGVVANDDDAMPRAWLVRFGRTVADQVVDAVSGRLEGTPSPHLTVGGVPVQIGMGTAPGEPSLREPAGAMSMPGRESETRTAALRDVMLGSSFHLSSGEAAGGPTYAAWGRFAQGGFKARVNGTRLDGNVTIGMVGVDADWGDVLAGVAVSRSDGRGGFALSRGTASKRQRGDVKSTLTAIYPYARLKLNDRTTLWGLAGFGRGDLTLSEDGGTPIRTDAGLRLGAVGAQGTLVPAAEGGGIAVKLKSDAFWVRTSSEAVRSDATGNLEASQGRATRVRIALRGEHAFALGERGDTITPGVQIGVRHDGGDAETGTGLELGAGVRYEAPGVTVEGAARTLVSHNADGYREWSVSGSIRVDPGASGRGLLLRLAPSLGEGSPAGVRLRSLGGAQGLGAVDDLGEGSRLDAEIGYGLRAPLAGWVMTPYAGLTLAEDGGRRMSLGARWALATDVTFGVEGSRTERVGAAPESALVLRAAVRW